MTGGSTPGAPSDPAVVGRVVRPRGLVGEVVVELLQAAAAPWAEGRSVWLQEAWRRVVRCRVDNKGRWVIALEGIGDREAAEALRGAVVVIEAGELPELEQDNYYIHDLIGCRVQDVGGDDLGEVVAVVHGPQDQLEVERDGRRSLVPMARALMKEVDVQGRRIVVDVPPGLREVTGG